MTPDVKAFLLCSYRPKRKNPIWDGIVRPDVEAFLLCSYRPKRKNSIWDGIVRDLFARKNTERQHYSANYSLSLMESSALFIALSSHL